MIDIELIKTLIAAGCSVTVSASDDAPLQIRERKKMKAITFPSPSADVYKIDNTTCRLTQLDCRHGDCRECSVLIAKALEELGDRLVMLRGI